MFVIPEPTSKTNFLLAESTILGLSHAARARRDHLIFRSVFWTLITLVSTGITGWACYLVLDDYLDFPVVSVLETKLNKILEFPSVAICNLNPVPCNKLFERSLDYPALWKESGCSLGKQTSLEISTILGTYQRLYGKIPAQYDVLTSKTDLLNFLAYTFVDSATTRALLYDRNMTALLDDLDAFLLVYYNPSRMTTMKAAASRYHITNLLKLAKSHVWFAQMISPSIKANFGTVNVTSSNNITTLIVLLRAYRDSTMAGGAFDYGAYSSSPPLNFWQDWEDSLVAGKSLSTLTVPQKTVMDVASNGFFSFLNRTVSVFSKSPLVAALPFLYPDSIVPSLIMALNNTALVLNQQTDASMQQAIDSLKFFSGVVASKAPSITELISSKRSLVGDTFTDMFISLPADEQQTMALTYDSLFLSCSFKGIACNESDFMKFMNTKYGQCFIFNGEMKRTIDQNVPSGANTSVIGVAGGLSLKLSVDDDQYIRSNYKETSGARIAIMPPRTTPNVFDSGYSVQPGQETNFELKQRDIERLAYPYPSDCVTFWNETEYAIYNLDYDYKACLRFCKIHEIYSQCLCIDQGYIREFTINGMGLDYVPYCMEAKRDNQSECVEKVKRRIQENSVSFDCSCKPACKEREYEVMTSTAMYPSLAYSEYTGSLFSVNELITSQNWEMLKKNYVKINVYFAAFDSLSTREESKYSVFSLAGNFGGAASLMLGFCGVTILEVFFLVWDISLDCLEKKKEQNSSGNRNQVEDLKRKSALMAQNNMAWGFPLAKTSIPAPPEMPKYPK